MKYFDAKTGAVIDSVENRWDVENRLAQRYPLVPVEGVALEIIEAGRESLGIETNVPGPIETLHDRPPALESEEEALENYEREEEERRKASLAGTLAESGAPVEPDEDPRSAHERGAPAENSDEREARESREAEAAAKAEAEGAEAPVEPSGESQGADDAVKTREDGEAEAKSTGKTVQESQAKASAKDRKKS